jgi:RNA polymerase sigma factor (sigma-70 family)
MAVVISDRVLESSDRLLDAEPDEQLVKLVQAGHDAAFAAIVRRYEPELQAQAHRLTSDGRGEDAVQQAFLNAFAALQGGAGVRHLRGWLHQILRNEVTRARLPIDAPLDAMVADGETLEDTVQRRASAHAALAELSALPDRQRDALLGTAVFGFPRAHVARTMGLSEGAVRQLVHRARLRLRQGLTALIPFPLVKFFGSARSGVDAAPDAALGAGAAAASGGLAIKVGALLASGVVATGIAVTHSFPSPHHAAKPQAGRHVTHTRATGHASTASGASAQPVAVITHPRAGDHGSGSVGQHKRANGGPGRLSGTRSGRHGGSGPVRGGSAGSGRGQEGSSSGSSDDGSGRSPGGSPARGEGSSGSGSSTSSGSGSGSRSGSGDDGSGSGRGRGGSGSGSGGGHGSGSGSKPTSAAGSAGSGSDDGAGSSVDTDGNGSGRSSGGDGATSTDATDTSSPGSTGSTPSLTTTGGETSGGDGGSSSGGSGKTSMAILGTAAAAPTSGSDGDQENSHGSRDLSATADSSSS